MGWNVVGFVGFGLTLVSLGCQASEPFKYSFGRGLQANVTAMDVEFECGDSPGSLTLRVEDGGIQLSDLKYQGQNLGDAAYIELEGSGPASIRQVIVSCKDSESVINIDVSAVQRGPQYSYDIVYTFRDGSYSGALRSTE